MKTQIATTIIALLFGSTAVLAATHYVDINNTAPQAPYTNWVTAATNIQDAVDEASAGERVVVTNGTYELASPVVVPAAIRVEGSDAPGLTIAIAVNSNRCFQLGAGAFLGGVTITNGYSSGSSGGISCADESAIVSNCIIRGNTGYDGGGMVDGTAYDCEFTGNRALANGGGTHNTHAYNCTFTENTATEKGGGFSIFANAAIPSNCVFIGNTADRGGGAYEATKVIDCVFSNNLAVRSGGAVYQGHTAHNCIFTDNTASNDNGGALYRVDAYDCFFTNNWAHDNGGALYAASASNCIFVGNYAGASGGAKSWWNTTMQDCVFISNTAGVRGGAVNDGQLHNCIFYSNHSTDRGGAVSEADLYNCVLYNNSANNEGGGLVQGSARNSILWSNSAPLGNDSYNATVISCYTADPSFVDAANNDFHLQATSPCIDAGSNALTHASLDFDGIPRPLDGDTNGTAVIDIGCYEFLIATADSDGDTMPDGWENDNGLNAAAADATGNPDNDPFTSGEEYIAGTDPINALSYLRITNATDTASGYLIEWAPSVSNREYSLLWIDSLTNHFQTLETGIDYPQNSATDTTYHTENKGFYRVEVKLK